MPGYGLGGYGLGPYGGNASDNDLLKLMCYMLLEGENGTDATGTTTLTTMFSISQFLAALNQRQERFLRDTAAVVTLVTLPTTPQIARYRLPDDWIHTRRLSWQANVATVLQPLHALARVDSFQLDHGFLDWQQNFADPTCYNDGSDLPTLTVELAKAPANEGQMKLMYVAQPQTLANAPTALGVPDEFSWPILFGALADCLVAEGDSHDPQRGAFCESMYDLGVEMTRAMLEGRA